MMSSIDRSFLVSLFNAAVAAADPKEALRGHLPDRPKGRTVVIGAGKGSSQLAAAFEDLWGEPVEGVVVTRYGYATPCRYLRVLEAAHPIPDKAGLNASKALLEAVSNLNEDDLVIALISGGGSSLLPALPNGLTLNDEQLLNSILLKSGAPIKVMNAIRKHVSQIKGGRLAAAAFPARVVTLVVSDVPGDDPSAVASGPTVPSEVSLEDTRSLITNYCIKLPKSIISHLENEAARAPIADDVIFSRNDTRVIASACLSLEAAQYESERQGIPAVILSDAIEGESRDVGLVHAALIHEIVAKNRPFVAPIVLLSGGETTVKMLNTGGRGGRNSEFLLSLATAIDGLDNVNALAADTDGIDGSEDNAGAFVDGKSVTRMRLSGLDPMRSLLTHNSWEAFEQVGDLFVTGPTGTNVNDFRAILIRPHK